MECLLYWRRIGDREKKGEVIEVLKGKKVLCIGERDGVAAPAIAECVKDAGGEPVLTLTQCFV